jgi:ParB family chromosome partitioning protein
MSEIKNEKRAEKFDAVLIEIGNLFPSKTNPRKRFCDEAAENLSRSIEVSGLLEPVVVRRSGEKFEIVAGERRYRALKSLGRDRVPCVVREMSDLDVVRAQLSENIARSELSPVEEAGALADLRELGVLEKDLAAEVSKSEGWVQARLDLGKLPEVVRDAVDIGELGLGSARALLQVDEVERVDFAQEILNYGDELTSDRVRDLVRDRYVRPRENRRKWAEHWEKVLKFEWGDLAAPVEDPELWGDYVHSYGEGRGKWKTGGDAIGGLAARESEKGVTWGELAEAHGLKGMLVPAGGVLGDDFENVVVLVDGGAIQSAERAAREAGRSFTIGPKVSDELGAPKQAPPAESSEANVETIDRKVEKSGWNPWVVRDHLLSLDDWEEVAPKSQVMLAVMDGECPGWRLESFEVISGGLRSFESVENGAISSVEDEFETWVPVVIWWCLRGEESPRLVRLAGILGLLDFWRECRA